MSLPSPVFFFNDTSTTTIYTLSLHDALPIYRMHGQRRGRSGVPAAAYRLRGVGNLSLDGDAAVGWCPHSERHRSRRHGEQSRSEEHTSELQSLAYLVCRLLLEKKKKHIHPP